MSVLFGGVGFAARGPITEGGRTYDVFEKGFARLDVEQGISLLGTFTSTPTFEGFLADNDILVGRSADEIFLSLGGNDGIDRRGEADTGGGGQDTFIFRNSQGSSTDVLSITDFEAGPGAVDVIELSGFSVTNFDEVQSLATATGVGGTDTLIDLTTNSSIILQGVAVSTLDADDFMFV